MAPVLAWDGWAPDEMARRAKGCSADEWEYDFVLVSRVGYVSRHEWVGYKRDRFVYCFAQ